MNTREIHSIVDDLTKIAWYKVRFETDDARDVHAYVQGDSAETVREIVQRHYYFDAYNTDEGSVERTTYTWNNVKPSLMRSGGANVAIGQDGEAIYGKEL